MQIHRRDSGLPESCVVPTNCLAVWLSLCSIWPSRKRLNFGMYKKRRIGWSKFIVKRGGGRKREKNTFSFPWSNNGYFIIRIFFRVGLCLLCIIFSLNKASNSNNRKLESNSIRNSNDNDVYEKKFQEFWELWMFTQYCLWMFWWITALLSYIVNEAVL